MSRIDTLIGKEAIHSDFGRVEVLRRASKGYTRAVIRVIQRGEGWDEMSQSYRPVQKARPNLNERGEKIGMTFTKTLTRRDEYGHEDVCHINELTLIEEEE